MPEQEATWETPRSIISYAGFPVSGANGLGLWCPECGLPTEGIVHNGEMVTAVHCLFRSTTEHRDTWYCKIQ